MAEKLEELRVFQMAEEFWRSVNPLFERPGYRKDRHLREQTSDANDSIPSNIAEGFEQGTDPLFVQYLYYSKGSLGEVISRLREAHLKGYLTEPELRARIAAGERLSRSLGALIRYLDGCGWKDRGRYKSRLRAEDLEVTRPASDESADRGRRTDQRRSGSGGLGTQGLGTEGPATKGLGTKGLGTEGPATKGLGTDGPGTDGPGTKRLGTEGLGTEGHGTKGPGTEGHGTKGLGTEGHGTKGLGTKGLGTEGPGTEGPGPQGP